MTSNQCRQARVLLKWSRARLGAMSGISEYIIAAYEDHGRVTKGYPTDARIEPVSAIRAALEAAGAEFIEENGGGPGVRLRSAREA